MLDDSDNVDAEVFAKSISNYYVMSYEFNINVPQVLAESVSDMLNTEFSKSVSDILETCGERLAAGGSKLCPPPEVFSSFVVLLDCHHCGFMDVVVLHDFQLGIPQDPVEGEERCQSQCLVNEECQYRELCCK